METFRIRLARTDDIPALAAIDAECFSEPWSESGFADFLSGDSAVCAVAEEDGQVVGYAGMLVSFGDGDITNIAVTAGYRRRGIASGLIRGLKMTPGVTRLFLEVRESNAGARALYEREGFVIDGRRRNFYSHPREDAVLMSLCCGGNGDTLCCPDGQQ